MQNEGTLTGCHLNCCIATSEEKAIEMTGNQNTDRQYEEKSESQEYGHQGCSRDD